jgi:transposase
MLAPGVPALPLLTSLDVTDIAVSEALITLTAAVASTLASCPSCTQPASRVHSRYTRTLKDLPWSGIPVQLQLIVRRFFCQMEGCSRVTFAEQVPGLTQRSAQRTTALKDELRTLGLVLGGNAGARLGHALGMNGSADTVLRQVHAAALPKPPAPRVVGIDEWAVRKGHRYGSILVDLERRQPVDLLPEHTSEAITAWLTNNPEVEIITRDRAQLYEAALAAGAPQAVQVADRWHLTQNLGTALQEMLARHTRDLRETARQLTLERAPASSSPAQAPLPPPYEPGHIVGPPELRQFQFAEAKRLRAAGWSYRRIAGHLQLDRRTVVNYIHAEQLPRRVLPQAMSSVTPYLDAVRQRWENGQHDGVQMLKALQALGYRGSLASVYRALKRFRSGDGRRETRSTAGERVAVRSPRQAMWLLIRRDEQLSEDDRAYREALCARSEEIAQARSLAGRFLLLVRGRDSEALESWLQDAEHSTIKELCSFARGLRRDAAAVRAALTTRWSNGQTEGQINRLKMIKRTMYGRASIPLLKQRVLHSG